MSLTIDRQEVLNGSLLARLPCVFIVPLLFLGLRGSLRRIALRCGLISLQCLCFKVSGFQGFRLKASGLRQRKISEILAVALRQKCMTVALRALSRTLIFVLARTLCAGIATYNTWRGQMRRLSPRNSTRSNRGIYLGNYCPRLLGLYLLSFIARSSAA